MIDLTTIARGDSSRISEPREIVARDAAEWTALWAAHAGPEAEVPAVDFRTRSVAAVFAGEKPSAGYAIEILRADTAPGQIRLVVNSRAPSPGTLTAQILTSPFHIVSLPRTAGEIRWVTGGPDAPRDAPVIGTRGRHVEAASTTGLKPKTASILAYMAGPFSGAIILLAESANETVRFHAWQSIIGIGAMFLFVGAAFTLAAASLLFSASTVPLMVGLARAVWVVMVIVWAICIWGAVAGRRWRLPLAGRWAERLATRRRMPNAE